MDMSPPDRTENDLAPKILPPATVETDEFQQNLGSETVLAAKIGIGGERRKSINRSDHTYRRA
jgi:hypothetical protein